MQTRSLPDLPFFWTFLCCLFLGQSLGEIKLKIPGQSSRPSFEGGLEIRSIRPQSAARLASKQPIAEA